MGQTNLLDNSSVKYRRLNNDGVCYFCNSHCETCNDRLQTTCLTCKRFNYMWYQRPHYCQESCPRGIYRRSPGDWYGEYIDESAIDTSTGIGDRTCHPCNADCRWCRKSPSFCLQCRDDYYLLDLHSECMARYITPNNCKECITYDTCNSTAYRADKQCVTACPTYFYFKLMMNDSSSLISSVHNFRYNNYTNIIYAN